MQTNQNEWGTKCIVPIPIVTNCPTISKSSFAYRYFLSDSLGLVQYNVQFKSLKGKVNYNNIAVTTQRLQFLCLIIKWNLYIRIYVRYTFNVIHYTYIQNIFSRTFNKCFPGYDDTCMLYVYACV